MSNLADFYPDVGVVLGSGLGDFIDLVHSEDVVDYDEFEEFPEPSVPGHQGKFHFGKLGKLSVLVAQGRVHLYEGRSAWDVGAVVRFMAECGVKRVVLTNAAGSLNKKFVPGGWMMLSDHLNLTGATPFLGEAAFYDMTEVYSASWRRHFSAVAERGGMTLYEGVYAGVLGPQYETPAEVRMLGKLGADAVGMSTVLEAMQARALGMEVAAFSCLTNWGAGIGHSSLSHEEVLETGASAAGELAELLAAAL